jgi:hypothetical protein
VAVVKEVAKVEIAEGWRIMPKLRGRCGLAARGRINVKNTAKSAVKAQHLKPLQAYQLLRVL